MATEVEIIYQWVRGNILRGTLNPATPLVVRQLSQELKVSRTPIVEALRKLEGEGLVEWVPGGNATVVQPKLIEIVEIYLLREALETMAVRVFTPLATEKDIQTLQQLSDDYDNALQSGDIELGLNLNFTFHLYIAQRTGMQRLVKWLEILLALDRLIGKVKLWGKLLPVETGIKGHCPIVNAIAAKDQEKAVEAMRTHLQRTRDDVLWALNILTFGDILKLKGMKKP